MIEEILNGYLILEYLSEIELYYTSPENIKSGRFFIFSEEFEHVVKVMRNKVGNHLYVTDGEGKIYAGKILEVRKNQLIAQINKEFSYNNDASNIWFCIPKLKNPERLKFAIEKCVELGITNFVLFNSKHTISKSLNIQRLKKIAISAMKQSLRSFLPKIISAGYNEIIKMNGIKLLFDQNAAQKWQDNFSLNKNEPAYFIFGPEGGFDKSELDSVEEENWFELSPNRLRTETAVVKCASLLNLY